MSNEKTTVNSTVDPDEMRDVNEVFAEREQVFRRLKNTKGDVKVDVITERGIFANVVMYDERLKPTD